jgi:N-acetylneuraminic acid mutarotase
MFVWGGRTAAALFNNGGLYDPITDTWKTISAVGAPSARYGAKVVWTGSKVIVFGGFANLQDGTQGKNASLAPGGGIYDPATDQWEALPTAMAASNRGNHTAVWTGSQMIIWGGSPHSFNTSEVTVGTAGSFIGSGAIFH